MKKIILFVCVIFFSLITNAFGQQNDITESQFWQTLHAAQDKTVKIPNLSISKLNYFDEGKLRRTREITNETLASDKTRYLTVDKINGRVTSEEVVQIGQTYYCRKNSGGWTQAKEWCGEMSISGIPNQASVAFTVEEIKTDGKIGSLYKQYLTYGDVQAADGKGKYYYELKFWLNDEGLIMREEDKTGLTASDTVFDERVTTYEYNPKNLKIEAPITKRKSKTAKK